MRRINLELTRAPSKPTNIESRFIRISPSVNILLTQSRTGGAAKHFFHRAASLDSLYARGQAPFRCTGLARTRAAVSNQGSAATPAHVKHADIDHIAVIPSVIATTAYPGSAAVLHAAKIRLAARADIPKTVIEFHF